jgi:hypothetical protein
VRRDPLGEGEGIGGNWRGTVREMGEGRENRITKENMGGTRVGKNGRW